MMDQPTLKKLLLTAFACILMSCGDDTGTVTVGLEQLAEKQGLVFSYPRDQQTEVPTPAPMMLRFTSTINDAAPENVIILRDELGNAVDYSSRKIGNDRGLALTPDESLKPLSEYTLEIGEINLTDGLSQPRILTFFTRGLNEGSRSEVAVAGSFAMQRMIPDGQQLPILDFSNFRLQFSQPLDRDSVRYGDTLTLQGPSGLVDAQILTNGAYLTLAPDEDLTAGVEYTINLSPSITSIYGEIFTNTDITFIPKNSGSRSTLAQEVEGSQNGALVSELTGEPINAIPVSAVLLGDNNQSQLAGDIYAELAHIPTFPNTSPLRIKKGARLSGTSLDVLIGGQVPVGLNSGDVTIHFISDAMGYLLENPYSDLDEAPRQIILYMDIAISTEDPRADGAITQNLLHQELVGTAIVEDGRLVVNAVSMVQPRIMGVENAQSLLSFRMRSYLDQVNPPPPAEDTTPPTISSWVHDDIPDLYRPGDAIVVNVSEPLDAVSILPRENLKLTDFNGTDIPFRHHQHGAAIIMQPQTPLEYGMSYWVALLNGALDLSGNPAQSAAQILSLPNYDNATPQSAVVLTTYPGFPCVVTDTDLANDDVGRCLGGKADDDHIPLARMPANRPIDITFSQHMDPASINNSTFVVEEVDNTGTLIGGPVAGLIQLDTRSLTFTPDQPWQTGSFYRYTLKSVATAPACGVDAICDQRGLPLQTRLLFETPAEFPAAIEGGPNLAIFFQGMASDDDVMLTLHNLPSADVNANFIIDGAEAIPSVDPNALLNSIRLLPAPASNPDADGTSAFGVTVTDVNVGCGFDGSNIPLACPDQTYLHPASNLNADIVGFLSAADIALKYPTDSTIPAQVRANGGVLVYIYPTKIILSGTVVHVQLSDAVSAGCGGGVGLCFVVQPIPTGPLIVRIRHTCNAVLGNCAAPDYGRIKGWIVEENGTSKFEASLALYIDAPALAPDVVNDQGTPVAVTHDIYSKPINLELSGSLSFLNDGRQRLETVSLSAMNIDAQLNISGLFPNDRLYLTIPAGDAVLNYFSEPIKP